MNWEKHCKNCKKDVHCCRFRDGEGFAFVDIETAQKIRKNTGKEYKDFLDYTPLNKKMVRAMKIEDEHLEGSMRLGLLDEQDRILRLKINNDRCIFLNDEGKCEIYDIRPNICRIYPLWAMRLINGQLKVIRHDEYPKCSIILELEKVKGDMTDMDDVLVKEKTSDVKKIMKAIEKENEFYKKNIAEFAEKNNLY